MKKSLIAVAALAAVGAASAQSSVTLYGVVDTGYGVTQTKHKVNLPATAVSAPESATVKERTVGLHSGGLSGSRWGLKGQEDLGNGLSAVFNVEAGFDSTNGAFKNGGFARRSVVGLKGGFGQVLLGRDYTPMDSIASDYQASDLVTGDGQFDAKILPTIGMLRMIDPTIPATAKVDSAVFGKSFYTPRVDGIHYAGEFGGVGVKAFVGYNDTKTTTTEVVGAVGNTSSTRVRDEGYGIGVSYTGGPVTVGAAVQQFRGKSNTVTTRKDTQYGVGATYDFNVAKLHAHYLANDDRYTKPIQQFGVGVTAPFGAFTLGAQYAYNYWKGPSSAVTTTHTDPVTGDKITVTRALFAGNNVKAKGHDFVLQGTYALSKRTDVYARAARTNSWKIKEAGATTQVHTDSFAVGLRHRF